MNNRQGIYFTDFFEVDPAALAEYGAFNVSPWLDMPLFIDPFLLFASPKPEYQLLHDGIIEYLLYLKSLASDNSRISAGDLKHLYCFKEVRQNCLGFSIEGTRGSGLGPKFGSALHENFRGAFGEFGEEIISRGAHIEKLVFIQSRVGRDRISDLTTNLIKGYLLEYTQKFALQFISPEKIGKFAVEKSHFNFDLGIWDSATFQLPKFGDSYILLTPEDLLTKDDTWINKEELRKDFTHIRDSISDSELRDRINAYFRSVLPKRFEKNKYGILEELPPTKDDENEAIWKTVQKFPSVVDYYIKKKEDTGEQALSEAASKVAEVKSQLVDSIQKLVSILSQRSKFFDIPLNSLDEAREKISWFKHVIEDQDGYRIFYDKNKKPIKLESRFQLLFKFVWRNSISAFDAEVNNGRGPVDFKVSNGRNDQTLIEFKLASNSGLRANLEHQIEIYKKANNTNQSFVVVLYFDADELANLQRILPDLTEAKRSGIVLIDARSDNKPSASKAR